MRIEGWQRIILLFVPYLIIVGFFQFLGMTIAELPFDQINSYRSLYQDVIISIFNGIGVILVLFLFIKYIDKERFFPVELILNNRLSEIAIALLISLFIIGGGWTILIILKQIKISQLIINPQLIALSLVLFGITAFTEEILFRGYILKNLLISFSKITSLSISSFLFLLMHAINPDLNWIAILNLILAGFALGISYVYTKNLWFPITLHFGWNFFQTHFGFNVSGQDSYSILETTINESNILNGGNFGFEGSILSLVFLSVIIILLFLFFSKKNTDKATGVGTRLFTPALNESSRKPHSCN